MMALLFVFALAVGFTVSTPEDAMAIACCYECPIGCYGGLGEGGIFYAGECHLVDAGHDCYNPLPYCFCP